jgi:hypothetical protein
MADETFTVGPPDPVTDSRELPAVTDEDEAGFVHGADLGANHPDNDVSDAEVAAIFAEIEAEIEDLLTEDEVAAVVAGVDTAAVDDVGFDEGDLAEPLDADGSVIDGGGATEGAPTGGSA